MTTSATKPAARTARLKLSVRGAVQGVGFRPFVYRLAKELRLCGWVNNSSQGVFLEVEGARDRLKQFLLRLETEKPPRSFIQSCEASWLDAVGHDGFVIRESECGGDKTALVLPDIATCPDCLREIFNPNNRRFRYPFTNCTNCGPRFSIIEALPYDRLNTSMKQFAMCPACQAEYDDPRNRRFHAQPNACPVCGPRLEFWGSADFPAFASGFGAVASKRSEDGQVCCIAGLKTCAPSDVARPADLEIGDTAGLETCTLLARDDDALLAAVDALRRGQIVAVKGIGGFHLLVDARNEIAVRRLRERKHREEKPLALMFPSLDSVEAICEVSLLEERLLRSPEAPIVLLRRLVRPHPGPRPQERANGSPLSGESKAADCLRGSGRNGALDCFPLSPGERVRVRASVELTHFEIAPSIAPGNPNLGVMLPSNPLHHLLMAELGFPVVATSGNLSDEPICTDECEARERLRDIADVFLVHNRPIVRHLDDSIVRVMLDREMVLRRARGYAPLPISVLPASRWQSHQACRQDAGSTILAVGAHLKNAVALAVGEQVFISQHIGDLETEQANAAFQRVAVDLPRLYDAQPKIIAADLHPDYLSTKFAREQVAQASRPAGSGDIPATGRSAVQGCAANSQAGSLRHFPVQHHIAHVLSCMAENELAPPVLGVAWDGTGYGTDGTIWGGEFFLVTEHEVERVAHLRPFGLPGGEAAAKEPRRAALGVFHEMYGDLRFCQHDCKTLEAFSAAELATLTILLTRGLNSPSCCSVGRLFDAVASLTGLRQKMHFEGQAAMELEFALAGIVTDDAYELAIGNRQSAIRLDWSPMIQAILADVEREVPVAVISAKFHNALAEAIVAVARLVGEPRVALSGGCFQNRYLIERTVSRLRDEGFQPYWHQRVPTNDGGIALGQIVAAHREFARSSAAFTPLRHPVDGLLSVPNDSPLITLKRAEARASSTAIRDQTISRITHHASR